jgi:hypothetical protein
MYIFTLFLISGIHFMNKFVIFDIRTNKINFLIFLKYSSSSHKFHKPVIKSKNICKDINKTIFLEFLYLRMLNHAMFFFILIIYANMIIFLERLDYMQIKIKIVLLKERFFVVVFCGRKLIYLIPKKHLACRIQILNIKG